jgi:hypothetical protein
MLDTKNFDSVVQAFKTELGESLFLWELLSLCDTFVECVRLGDTFTVQEFLALTEYGTLKERAHFDFFNGAHDGHEIFRCVTCFAYEAIGEN